MDAVVGFVAGAAAGFVFVAGALCYAIFHEGDR